MTSLLNFIKIYHLVQTLLGGKHRHTDGQTDRQTGDLISLTFIFKESRLKNCMLFCLVFWKGDRMASEVNNSKLQLNLFLS
jgi:hypothetical protein